MLQSKFTFQLKRAYKAQGEELRLVKKQLANSEIRVKELEDQIRRLQQHLWSDTIQCFQLDSQL